MSCVADAFETRPADGREPQIYALPQGGLCLWTQPPALEGRPLMVNRSQLLRRRIQLDAVPNAPSALRQGGAFQLHFLVSWGPNSTAELTPAQVGQKTYRVNWLKLTEFIDKLRPGIPAALVAISRFLGRSGSGQMR